MGFAKSFKSMLQTSGYFTIKYLRRNFLTHKDIILDNQNAIIIVKNITINAINFP